MPVSIDQKPPADRQTRTQTALARKIDGDDRRVEIAVSSETPVGRGFGDEILDHGKKSVDLTFFGNGSAPLLLDHDPTRQIGVVESARIDSDKILRAVVRFSKSVLAREIYTDVIDGIRSNTSVGYLIRDWASLPGDSGFLITNWSPMEVSIVSIPADPSVGVGRSVNQRNATMPELNTVADELAVSAERERTAEILAMAGRHKYPMEKAMRHVKKGTPLADFAEIVRDSLNEMPMIDNRVHSPALHLGGAPVYDFGKVLAASVTGDRRHIGYEVETAQEITHRTGQKAQGFLVPPAALVSRATLVSSGATDLFATDHMGGMFIEALKPSIAAGRLGATFISGLDKDIAIPGWDGTTADWVAEDTAPTDAAPTTRSVTLNYHQLSGTKNVSRKTIVQADPAVTELLKSDFLRQIAVSVDLAALAGTGASNQPLGILNTSGIGSVAMGTNGAAPTWAKCLALLQAVEAANITGNTMGFAANFKTKIAMMTTERSTGGTARFLIDDENIEKFAGYNIAFSGNVPGNLTKGTGTNLSAMIFGNWADLLVGQFGGIDVITDVYTESAKGNVRISVHSAWDVALRRAASFAAIKDLVTA